MGGKTSRRRRSALWTAALFFNFNPSSERSSVGRRPQIALLRIRLERWQIGIARWTGRSSSSAQTRATSSTGWPSTLLALYGTTGFSAQAGHKSYLGGALARRHLRPVY